MLRRYCSISHCQSCALQARPCPHEGIPLLFGSAHYFWVCLFYALTIESINLLLNIMIKLYLQLLRLIVGFMTLIGKLMVILRKEKEK